MIKHFKDKIQNAIQKELFKANGSIKVAVAWFTNEMLLQPLILNLKTGVSVELIINDDEINRNGASSLDFSEFIKSGGVLKWNTTSQLMHEKFCIIDDRIVISGSYNWTNKSEYNKEAITIFYDEYSTTKFFNDEFVELAAICNVDNSSYNNNNRVNGYIDDEGFFIDEFGAKYSGDRKVLIKGADVEKYVVDSQTEIIEEKAFFRLEHISEVIISQSVKTIAKEAFSGCISLKSIYIPTTLKSIDWNAFRGCDRLERVNISSLKAWCNIDFNSNPLEYAHHLYIKDFEIRNLVIPNGITSIKKCAFDGASSIISVQFPKDINSIEAYAFRGCGFSEISIPNTVTSIGEGAFNRTKLKSFNIPSGLQEIKNNTFEGCKDLSSIEIPGNIKVIGESAFLNCINLSTLIINNGVTCIDDVAFWLCYQLSSLVIPSSVKRICYNAFQTYNLSKISVDNNNHIYDSRNDCNAIIETATNKLILGSKNSVIPDTVSVIGEKAFAGYNELVSIIIPESVVSIEMDAFNSTGIYSITLPSNVTNIDYNTFYGCENLQVVIIKGKDTMIKHSFGHCVSLKFIIVPKGTSEKYKSMLDDVPEHVQFIEGESDMNYSAIW